MTHAYTDGRIFAIDLVGAVSDTILFVDLFTDPDIKVLRQSSFVQKMRDLGWTEPSFFEAEDDQVALQHAVARYHAYVQVNFSFRTIPVDNMD